MKKKIISWLVFFCPLTLFGQNIDSLVQAIRFEYNTIVADKEKYKTVSINMPLQDGENDELYIERIITYYIDDSGIKLISVASIECLPLCYAEFKHIEYYMKNNHVFFIYQRHKTDKYIFDEYLRVAATKIEERRTYYDSNQAIKCLVKKVEGEPSKIDFLLQKAANEDEDCSEMWNNSVFGEENMDSLLEYYRKHETQGEERIKKQVTKLYWINAETREQIETLSSGLKARLCFETKGYKKGEKVQARVKWKDGSKFENNATELIYTGIVDTNGIAISNEVYVNDVEKD